MSEFRSGNGAAWLDLLSTLAGRYRETRVDDLEDPARLRAWLRVNDLEPTSAVTDADVAAVQATREALHRTTLATMRAEPPADEDLRLLQEAMADDVPPRLRRDSGGLAVGRPETARQALAALVRDAVRMLAGDELSHLHTCGDDTCSSVFLDRSGRRRWCTDLSCGNRARVRAHRSRTNDTRQGP